jgi:hypothetical protein
VRHILRLLGEEESGESEWISRGIAPAADDEEVRTGRENRSKVKKIASPPTFVVEESDRLPNGVRKKGVGTHRVREVRLVRSREEERRGIVQRQLEPTQEFDRGCVLLRRHFLPAKLVQDEAERLCTRDARVERRREGPELAEEWTQGVRDLHENTPHGAVPVNRVSAEELRNEGFNRRTPRAQRIGTTEWCK